MKLRTRLILVMGLIVLIATVPLGYIVYQAQIQSHIDVFTGQALWKSLGISVLIFIIGLVSAILLAGSLAKPIESLTTVAERIADGNYDYEIAGSRVAEIESLSSSIDAMGRSIQKTIEELEKTQAIFSASFDACPAGILIADAPDVNIRMANPAALGVRGESSSSLTGIAVENHSRNWQTFNPDNTVLDSEDLPLSRAILKGETSSNVEVIIRRESGEDRWVLANAAPVRDSEDKIIAGVVVFVDVTDHHRAELALRETQTELLAHERREKELVEAELAKTHNELVHATRLATLGQLIATVSHELRNPLGSIRTAVFSVAGEVRGQAPLIDRALDRAERNIVRCDQIIEELLDFTREKNPEPVLTRIDRWLGEVLDEQEIPENIELVRAFNSDVKIEIDREQLRRCVINLITNACQAMEDTPTEHARMAVETLVEKDQLLIRVCDTGHGISPDGMDRIFEPLYTTRGFGTGLGLPVVQQIMERLEGEVEIISEPEVGTKAVLKLPLQSKYQGKKDEL